MGSSKWKEEVDKFAAEVNPGIMPKVYFAGTAKGLMFCLGQLVAYVNEM